MIKGGHYCPPLFFPYQLNFFIIAFCSAVTLMYFKKFDSVVCPVNCIIAIVGIPLKYIFVANERLAVCIPIISYLR